MADEVGIDCSHYLDDFFGVHQRPQDVLYAFCSIARGLGFTLRDEKLELGSRVEILGILVDTEACTASITDRRRKRYMAAIDEVLDHGSATATELATVAGCLVFTTRICRPGKGFLRSIYDAAGEAVRYVGKRRLPGTATRDLKWWRKVLRDWDGVTYLGRVRPDREVWSDASTTKGYRGHLGPQDSPQDVWQAPILAHLVGKDIMLLEALALLESLRRWRAQLAGCARGPHALATRLPNPPASWYTELGGDKRVAFYKWHGVKRHTAVICLRITGLHGVLPAERAAVLPAPTDLLEEWCAELASRMSGRSIKKQLSGIRSWHVDLGASTAGLESDNLRWTIRGIQRYHGERSKGQALPTTLPILRAIVNAIRRSPLLFGGRTAALTLVAAFCTAFACFLRCGSFTYDSFDRDFELCVHHLHLDASPPYLTLPASKTDPFRRGVDISLPDGPPDVSCIRALQDIMDATTGTDVSPLFSLSPDRPDFSRGIVIDTMLRKAVREARIGGDFTGHSFRRGAATWAASVGMGGDAIKTLGRWTSAAYERYVDSTPDARQALRRRMYIGTSSLPSSGVPLTAEVFDPAA